MSTKSNSPSFTVQPPASPSAFCILNSELSPAELPAPSSALRAPSPRDLEIHRQNAVELFSTRNIAERFALSQTRVRQIVARVNDWLAQMLPVPAEADIERQKRLALHLAAAQLQHQIEELQTFWHTTSDPKYLRQQTRAILALARLGVPASTLDAIVATLEDETAPPSSFLPHPSPDLSLVPRFPPGNAPPQGSPLGSPNLRPSPHPSEFCILNSEFSQPPPARACSPKPTVGSKPTAPPPAASPQTPLPPSDLAAALDNDPDHLAGLELMEKRLLTLLEGTPESDAESRQRLAETLERIRRERANCVLQIAPTVPGVAMSTQQTHAATQIA